MNKKIIIVAVAILLAIGAGAWFFMNRSNQESQSEKTVEETFVTQAPQPTEEPAFEKSDFSIKVLNGSGTVGLAGKLEGELKDAGFTVDSTGNADNYDYKNTIIQKKANVPDGFIELLKETLSDTYGTIDVEELSEDESVDVVIIIGGQQSKEEEKPTATPTKAASDSESTSSGQTGE
ncbi:hypothetical protein A3H80_02185 [Candidatus Roizmanbacteria bacterium RIFCSPLOWO2_02_FULL_37_19]|uniref:LytR/CpsA/Psr regulator C-terminal domain-containing protein n=1 Tax=Candidatus Roizmanbacteria bacterium RIFCSPHIGHO2_02_FULL_37_24 TaxID=1802037 RepID=A0A1F7H1D7_9BACT|nr:MAG: hypothetical protein A2862_02770 [Candidatus Roizmanbacteria bacterium RIFCSPHIGHO2_01_FULL_38_41]OGK24542.1 MAG: hypothetical protein A3C24_03265 [Candidatus Roizmanbacteria bacterium RIFCSPHIGHO2_02_FULL_37_24]OGK31996.1 MAG: hypothetical protein A3E10_04605 [Candidatus Roizmanbacteria bacterium RIFCSPHIGHO2_12_FULL_37_23]OGK43797.1 MAG: hypothetical protein A2956_04730 [Candidatus Roizmanbacteria bacterium RIFCSPLOWO2_01_FULL_37_57]OGK54351.1 MAG: hypothetical protein A3H80_02185 [Ca